MEKAQHHLSDRLASIADLSCTEKFKDTKTTDKRALAQQTSHSKEKRQRQHLRESLP
jgi:hypothetical protein